MSKTVAIVGGGLVGCLLGLYLRKRALNVSIFESRPDPRQQADTGRSINLIITSRGLAALTGVSDALARRVMAVAVPVFGRTLHDINGSLLYQAYGPGEPNPTSIHLAKPRLCRSVLLQLQCQSMGTEYVAVGRGGACWLSVVLLACIGAHRRRQWHACVLPAEPGYHPTLPEESSIQPCVWSWCENQTRVCGLLEMPNSEHADGGGSRCRQALAALAANNGSDVAQPLGYGYKELTIPGCVRGKNCVYMCAQCRVTPQCASTPTVCTSGRAARTS
jgi:hypothetical protein